MPRYKSILRVSMRPAVHEFGRYAMVGALNTVIDLGTFNALCAATGIWSGIYYSVFKAISFLISTANSFVWNRTWTFRAHGSRFSAHGLKFLVVSLVGWCLNVGVASLIVNVAPHSARITPQLFANIGALLGTAVSFLWNFSGYKFFVFKKHSARIAEI